MPDSLSSRLRRRPGQRWGPRRRRRTFAIAALFCLVAAFTCTPDIRPWLKTPEVKARLFNDLPSYLGPEETQKRLKLPSWVETKRAKGTSKACLSRSFDYKILIADVQHIVHHKVVGRLKLTFLNDKLVRTVFVTRQGQQYLDALAAQKIIPPGTKVPKGRKKISAMAKHTRVVLEKNHDLLSITWADTRLLKAYWEAQSRGSSRYLK